MDLNIYTKELSKELIPKIVKRFKDLKMDVEFHPEFKFDLKKDDGFLPIKLKVENGNSKQYDKIEFDILTGFEIYFNDYDYEEELAKNRKYEKLSEKKSFFSKLFGKREIEKSENNYLENEEIDQILKKCNKDIFITFKSQNKSELRVSLLFATILAELTNGIILDPQNGRYLNGKEALKTFALEIDEYENSFTEKEFTVNKFENW